jgi:hypothetical protein
MESGTILQVRRHFVMALEAELALGLSLEWTVAASAFALDIGMSLDHRSRHHELLEIDGGGAGGCHQEKPSNQRRQFEVASDHARSRSETREVKRVESIHVHCEYVHGRRNEEQ